MRLVAALLLWTCLGLGCGPAFGQTLEELITQLPAGDFTKRAEVVAKIGATGDQRAAAVLDALQEGDLQARKSDGVVMRVTGRGSSAHGFDPLTGADLGPVAA